MTEVSRDERKKLFAEIMSSLKEYSTEDIDDPEEAKDKILQLLKTHRSVKLCDYVYGLSRNLHPNHRLIIKELNDKSKVREYVYAQSSKTWFCCNRNSTRCKCGSSNLKTQYGIVFAPLNHSDACETRDYLFAMKVQDLLKHGKIKEARGLPNLGKRNGRSAARRSSSSTSMLSESYFSNAGVVDSSIFEDSFSGVNTTSASNNSNIMPPSSQRSSSTLTPSARSSVKQEIYEDDDDCCMIIEEPAAKKPKIELPTIELFENENDKDDADNERFEFDRPSSYILKKVCKKLKIEYNDNAYKIWVDMVFSKILPRPNNVKIHSLKSPNFYACLSLLFTGKANSCFLVQHVICEALREDPTVFGSKSKEEIEQILINITVYDEQIEFIAKFLSCRIGIYYYGNLKKFGKWKQNEEENENILTLILSFEAGLYSIVKDLS